MKTSLMFKPIFFALLTLSMANAQPPSVAPAEDADENATAVAAQEPKPELERPTMWGEPTKVEASIYVIDVDEVESAQQRFAASVYLEAHWNSPHLTHEGPGPIYRRVTDVWTPRLVTVNQQAA